MSNNPWPSSRERSVEAAADAIIERETAERATLKTAAASFRVTLLSLELRYGTGSEWSRAEVVEMLDDILAAPDEPDAETVYIEAERGYSDRAADEADRRYSIASDWR